jgi:hypothetical protein
MPGTRDTVLNKTEHDMAAMLLPAMAFFNTAEARQRQN